MVRYLEKMLFSAIFRIFLNTLGFSDVLLLFIHLLVNTVSPHYNGCGMPDQKWRIQILFVAKVKPILAFFVSL